MLKVLVSIALIFTSFFSFAQNKPQLPYALKGSIDTQFYYLGTLSRSQDIDFKIIRKSNLDILKSNTLDTIKKLKKEIETLKDASSSSVSVTSGLQDSIATLNAALSQEQEKTDNISFLGLAFDKKVYHTIVWSLILVFFLAFSICLFAFRKSKVDTVSHKNTVDELQEELQTVKKKSMEKEQLLKRQLLDEQMKRNQ